MEDFTYINKVRKIIKMRHDDIVSAMASGGVDNMEKYQYISQEISSLLEKKERKDNEGTIININGSKAKDRTTE